MNIALILAGGSGIRTEQDVPKQFLNVYEKPIILYTLEAFQKHPDINGIIVSCLEGWHEILRVYARDVGITKLQKIVSGGETGQASARNALRELNDVCQEDDIVIIHDAIRPMVSADIISDCIVKCRKYGSDWRLCGARRRSSRQKTASRETRESAEKILCGYRLLRHIGMAGL